MPCPGFVPTPRLHSLQNFCASSLSSLRHVKHLIMSFLHYENLPAARASTPRAWGSLHVLIILMYVILFMSAGSLDLQVAGDALPLWIADRGSAQHDANAMRLPIIDEPDAEVTGQRNAFNLD